MATVGGTVGRWGAGGSVPGHREASPPPAGDESARPCAEETAVCQRVPGPVRAARLCASAGFDRHLWRPAYRSIASSTRRRTSRGRCSISHSVSKRPDSAVAKASVPTRVNRSRKDWTIATWRIFRNGAWATCRRTTPCMVRIRRSVRINVRDDQSNACQPIRTETAASPKIAAWISVQFTNARSSRDR